jgi:hypothetical protein
MKAPLNGQFEEHIYKQEISAVKLDYNKYYTYILSKIEYIPAVNSFDKFCAYDYKDEIQDYNVYFVEKLDKAQTYPFHKFSLCYGMNIDGVDSIKIIAVLQISKKTKTLQMVLLKSYTMMRNCQIK